MKIIKSSKRLHLLYLGRTLMALLVIGLTGFVSAQVSRPHVKIEAELGALQGGANIQSDVTASGGSAVGFTQAGQACGVGQVGTPPNCFSASAALGVNAGTTVNAFDRKMKGMSLGNWTFNFGRPYIGNIPGLGQAMGAIDPAIIRYSGGLKANYMGFDRAQPNPVFDVAWNKNGQTYYERYGTNELASLDSFAKSLNAEVMIQVNISNNDPSMWADLVRYAKERNWTSFKYYEFGNELDLETFSNSASKIDPATYASRAAAYQQAMLAVDPTIKIVGGVPATASDIMRTGYSCCGNNVSAYIMQALPALRNAGRDMSAASIHWYQGGPTAADAFRWSWPDEYPTTSGDWWRNSYARKWSGGVASWMRNAMSAYPNTEIGISELGVDSDNAVINNGNHVGALWYSDVLGRLAYTGVDWVTQWATYASQPESFSLIYPNNQDSQTPTLHARPTYAAYLMYSKYFGDQMVQSSTFDESRISVWASRDSDDPGKLKLRLTNLTSSAITTPIALNGFSASSGQAYVMSSTNPLDQSAASMTSSAPTTINGVKINAMNVNASLSSIQPVNVPVNGTSFNYTIPAYSSVAIVLSGSF